MASRCLLSDLQNFLGSATGIQITSQSSLSQRPNEPESVVKGTFIVLSCASGFTNVGGSLNVTCGTNSQWSPIPRCVSAIQMTTMSTSATAAQVTSLVGQAYGNCNDIPSIANGFVSNASAVQFSNNQFRRQIHFTCLPEFMHVNTSGQRWVSCSNAVLTILKYSLLIVVSRKVRQVVLEPIQVKLHIFIVIFISEYCQASYRVRFLMYVR